MAVDFTKQKQDTVSRFSSQVKTLLDLLVDMQQLRQEAIDNGFQPGGANGLTDNELNGVPNPPFPHLDTAAITAAFAAVSAIDTTLAASTRTHYKALARLK